MIHLKFLLVTLLAVFWMATPAAAQAEPKPFRAVVTLAPLKGLLEPLLPPGATVTVLMKPGRSEHAYEFTPADLALLSQADVVFYNGLGLERRVEDALAKPGTKPRAVVNFGDAVGIKLPEGDAHEGHDHEHGEACEHGHGPVDVHLWLDPVLVAQVVPALQNAVTQAMTARGAMSPAEATRLEAAAAATLARVRAMDQAWAKTLEPFQGRAIVTHHNAFPRAAERYGFKVAAVIRPQETSEPSPGDIAKVIQQVKEQKVKAIYIEDRFNRAAADKIARAAKVKVLRLEPIGDGDWFKLMQSNLDSLVEGLKDE